ncbi:MAG: vanadium-dependent haloperoxidase [Segetibacter sp.]|nr:vanadium-dependent haloperoxidase [Segetibacter sp.]
MKCLQDLKRFNVFYLYVIYHSCFMRARFLGLLTILIAVFSCQTKIEKADPKILTDQNLLHDNVHQLTEVIINDMFSPPVSSRIYAYSSLAAYEAIRFERQLFIYCERPEWIYRNACSGKK